MRDAGVVVYTIGMDTYGQGDATLEDVDIAEAVMELELQQTAYEAALAAFARSAQTSLVDFLR